MRGSAVNVVIVKVIIYRWCTMHTLRSKSTGRFIMRDSCTGRYCWERVLAMGILSVRPSVCLPRPGTNSKPGEIETPGLHHMIA